MSASSSAVNSARSARRLGDLLASVEVSSDWSEVERNAQSLANGLRVRGGPVDEQTALGRTLLPQTLTSLLKAAVGGPRIPDISRAPAVFELLRVAANLCLDHDENRGYLLEAGFPQVVVSLLEGYTEALPPVPQQAPLPLPSPHLRVVKTAVGAILNLSLGYEPVQSRLISLEVAVTLLRLSVAIYPPGAWLKESKSSPDEALTDAWVLRRNISEWSWRTIAGLKDNKNNQPLFGPESLPSLTAPLLAFVPPFPTPSGYIFADRELRRALLTADFECLEEVCELLESLSIDVDDVRFALAQESGRPCLLQTLDFVEKGEYLPYWSEEPAEETVRWKNGLNLCKTAVIKAIVETTGDEKNLELLWDVQESGGFVARMTKWLRDAQNAEPSEARDDLVICAALSLGNLCRRENHSVTLVKPPISITPHLVHHLTPESDWKVKHGVVGLLKHLSQSPANRPVIGEAQAIQRLRTCQLFSEKGDMVEVVQMSGINLTKHLCTHNVNNSIIVVMDRDEGQPSSSCLNQILALSSRSDSVPVKSEGARVLVNIVKSLYSNTGDIQDRRRQEAIQAVTTAECANALAQLLGRSRRHVVLLNESIMAMFLLAHQKSGASIVLDAILAPLPKEAAPPSRQNSIVVTGGDPASPVVGPSTALDMFVLILKNPGTTFPAELRANLCGLLAEIGKAQGETRTREVEKLRAAIRPCLEALKHTPESLVLSDAAKKALAAW